ncbi:hypothetical protein [Evansella tamaricis]|uniref:Uncharacterized protein n=1 Tax=Evansella tamaricis TaxID=2069301 RepID=A0ABS6JCM8_9BACI|nr:hypothetical protein [Evansella tamaricis]MBU9710180.1 hypothetical protein [Evansella tamaricis]
MNNKELENYIIKQYQNDEQIMILIFAQWCINHHLDPEEMYRRAYPNHEKNPSLQQSIKQTVSKEEATIISDDSLLHVLSLFGNDDLAFIVSEEISKQKTTK